MPVRKSATFACRCYRDSGAFRRCQASNLWQLLSALRIQAGLKTRAHPVLKACLAHHDTTNDLTSLSGSHVATCQSSSTLNRCEGCLWAFPSHPHAPTTTLASYSTDATRCEATFQKLLADGALQDLCLRSMDRSPVLKSHFACASVKGMPVPGPSPWLGRPSRREETVSLRPGI
jgi:hypothetical protein